MLLIEINCDDYELYFSGVPKIYHSELIAMYYRSFEELKNKPDFVKACSFNLLRLQFIQNNFISLDIKKSLIDFTSYYERLKKEKHESIKLGYEEDLQEFIFDYLQFN